MLLNVKNLTLIISCKDVMLPKLAGSGEGDVSEGLGSAGGRSRGLGGATLLAPLYAGKVGLIGVGFDISGLPVRLSFAIGAIFVTCDYKIFSYVKM